MVAGVQLQVEQSFQVRVERRVLNLNGTLCGCWVQGHVEVVHMDLNLMCPVIHGGNYILAELVRSSAKFGELT